MISEDDLHFPEQIQKRIDAGMGCGSGIGPGWMKLVTELDEKLAKIHPDYKIDQIKEKFGGLRFYTSGIDSDEGYDLINEAENKSYEICDVCGKPGTLGNNGRGWMVTRCAAHSKPDPDVEV